MEGKYHISLIIGLFFLNNVSLQASLSEKCAEYFFKEAISHIKSTESLNAYHSHMLLANSATLVALGVSGLLTATSLLVTYKKILSEGKSGEWKGTKITAGMFVALGCGTVAGVSYLGEKVTKKLSMWTNSRTNFVKKCGLLKLQSLLQ